MKKYKLILFMFAAVFTAACHKDNQSGGQAPAVTGGYTDLTDVSVTIFGWCNKSGVDGASAAYGVEYSATDLTTDPSYVRAVSKDSGNKFSCDLTGLTPNTKYYYRTFVFKDKSFDFGEICTFTTKDFTAQVSMSVSDVTSSSATFNGKLALSRPVEYKKAVCFYFSNTESAARRLVDFGTKADAVLAADGTFSAKASLPLHAGTQYWVVAYAKVANSEFVSQVSDFTTSTDIPVPQAVDMGRSVLWGSFNIGASKPEEYGDYYAWGETDTYYEAGQSQSASPVWKQGKEAGYVWDTYKWWNSTRSQLLKYNTLSKYGNVDDKTVLEKSDDVAYEKLGGTWRMPTEQDFIDLWRNSDWEWTSLGGVNGVKFTSKINGNSIFLPAAGIRKDQNLEGVGSTFYYFSSTLRSSEPETVTSLFYKSWEKQVYWGYFNRCDGQNIRPVMDVRK